MTSNLPSWLRFVAIPGMMIFGTATVVIQKFLFDQKGYGVDEYGEHYFQKPWFMTVAMFIGMLLALPVYFVMKFFEKPAEDESMQVIGPEAEIRDTPPVAEKKTSSLKLFFSIAIPAACDLVSTGLLNIGLLYITASVWQMLRGSMVPFTLIFSAFILKRPHYSFMWWSVLIITISLVIVGVSSICSTGVANEGTTSLQVFYSILLVIGSQVISASKMCIEEYLLHNLTAHPFLVVGIEGFWGTVFSLGIFLPITQYITGMEEGNGIREDWWDTIQMLGNSSIILGFSLSYVFVILFYNVSGMLVTTISTAVVRTIMEGLRSLCIWIAQVIIYYSLKGTDYGKEHPKLGEKLSYWSFLELAGFLLFLVGLFSYNRIIKFPCFKYPDNAQILNDQAKINGGEVNPEPLLNE